MRQLSAHQRACLQGAGVRLWRSRDAAPWEDENSTPGLNSETQAAELAQSAPPVTVSKNTQVAQAAPGPEPQKPPEEPAVLSTAQVSVEFESFKSLSALEPVVAQCTLCELSQSRTQTVFGVGTDRPSVMIIGEAPGRDEDLQGEPFVGRAGQLLSKMLLAIGLQREQVYITNILKCRPPNNRDPKPEEMQQCAGYLLRQIELLQPKVLLAAGRISAQNLLQVSTPVGKLRGSWHTHEASGLPMLVTYHPAYLLRNPREKVKSWEDLQRLSLLMQTL